MRIFDSVSLGGDYMLYALIELRSLPELVFALYFTQLNYEYNFPPMIPNLEVLYIQSGTMTLHLLDQVITSEAGSFIMLPHKYPLFVETQKDAVHIHYTISIRADNITELYDHPVRRKDDGRSLTIPICLPPCAKTPELLSKLKHVISEYHSSRASSAWKSGCLAAALLYDIARASTEQNEDKPLAPAHILCYRIKTYVAQHLAEPITLRKLSDALGKTPGYLSHVFRSVEGTSILQYINHEKVSHAAELVVAKRLTLKQAAAAVGVADPNYLSRMFRKQMGVALSEFRRNSRESTVSLVDHEKIQRDSQT